MVRRRLGYRYAILGAQGLAVVCLGVMALTDFWQGVEGVFWVAAVAYVLRRPLMNMANPSASELSQLYVGDSNRELLSAISSGIWSGAWFFSAKVLQFLRAHEVPYGGIFLTTSSLYVVGILLHARLIRRFERHQPSTIEEVAPVAATIP